jgi:RNA polymerase sigma factor (sigma-70 family)
MRSELEATRAIEQYADMVRRICFLHLKNFSDTEDIFQDVFLKYVLCPIEFESKAHEKAWLIRVTINACKDLLKSVFRKNTVSLDALPEVIADMSSENHMLLESVLALPKKYKDVIYLHYYEGYSAAEIGDILGKKTNTIYSTLSRARDMLRAQLGGDLLA